MSLCLVKGCFSIRRFNRFIRSPSKQGFNHLPITPHRSDMQRCFPRKRPKIQLRGTVVFSSVIDIGTVLDEQPDSGSLIVICSMMQRRLTTARHGVVNLRACIKQIRDERNVSGEGGKR